MAVKFNHAEWFRHAFDGVVPEKVMYVAARHSKGSGFTLIELMAVVAIIGALAALSMPMYAGYVEKIRRGIAIQDIRRIGAALDNFYLEQNRYPSSLDELGAYPPDPWGRPYVYLPINTRPAPNRGAVRKDKNLVPLNSDYDLYSLGRDGRSQKPLTAAASRDDIVRAGNGAFIGVATDH